MLAVSFYKHDSVTDSVTESSTLKQLYKIIAVLLCFVFVTACNGKEADKNGDTTLKRRDEDLTKLFKRLYEDNVLGKIPNEVFRKLSDDYLAEQKEIQSTIPIKESKLEKLKDSVANVTAFIQEAKEITEINELNATILHRFIDRIVVGERTEKYSRTALQEIQIHYRYIGLLDDVIEQPASREQQNIA